MRQSVTLTANATPLALDAVFRASPLILAGDSITGVTTYRAQLWRRPQDARVADAEPLASAYGAASAGAVSVAFSGSQMDIELEADNGGYDDLWITLAGVQSDGQLIVFRAGWLRVIESGADPEAFVIEGITITVEDGIATYTIDGETYTSPVLSVPVTPGTTGWEISFVDEVMILTKDGESWAVEAEKTS